jgi:HNH endonuclease
MQKHSGRMRRLAASDLLPERAGQPVRAWVHVSLADLLRLQGSSALLEQWTVQVRAQWAARSAAASEGGGSEGAWLGGDAAGAIICDAAMAPVVTGEVNVDALDELVRLCVLLDRHRRGAVNDGADDAADGAEDGAGGADDVAGAEAAGGAAGSDGRDPGRPAAGASPAWEAIERAVIGKAIDLLSGPAGLASFLRRRQLGARLAGPSLPLDIGYSTTIPAGIRNAVILRDRRCRWPGGCDQPAACDVHHVKHKANGGHTSTTNCVLLCFYHHQVAIHRQGWTLVLNPDGTTAAWNKDKTKVLHSHGPPARAG